MFLLRCLYFFSIFNFSSKEVFQVLLKTFWWTVENLLFLPLLLLPFLFPPLPPPSVFLLYFFHNPWVLSMLPAFFSYTHPKFVFFFFLFFFPLSLSSFPPTYFYQESIFPAYFPNLSSSHSLISPSAGMLLLFHEAHSLLGSIQNLSGMRFATPSIMAARNA